MIVLAVLTVTGVVAAVVPSAVAQLPAASPKGRVYLGTGAGNPWVVYIGQGPNPVPATMIELDSTFCRNNAGTPRPAVRTGFVNVTAAQNGMRSVQQATSFRFVCANQAKTTLTVGFGFSYDTAKDELMAPDPVQPVVLSRICNGNSVPGFNLIKGTAKADTLNGTSGKDIIEGRGGSDTINGRLGDDIVCAGNGDDVVHGNGGVDLILGQSGRDEAFGDGDIDVIFGGSNPRKRNGSIVPRELLNGGPSWDILFGWAGWDKLVGAAGPDLLYGGPQSDVMVGGLGIDECHDPAGKTYKGCEVTGP